MGEAARVLEFVEESDAVPEGQRVDVDPGDAVPAPADNQATSSGRTGRSIRDAVCLLGSQSVNLHHVATASLCSLSRGASSQRLTTLLDPVESPTRLTGSRSLAGQEAVGQRCPAAILQIRPRVLPNRSYGNPMELAIGKGDTPFSAENVRIDEASFVGIGSGFSETGLWN